MAHFHHEPADGEPENLEQSERRARYGRWLCAVYMLLYGGFVLLCAFAPGMMARTPLAGVNAAILYGLSLIVAAFLLALFYDWLCRARLDRRRGSNAAEAR